VSKYGHGSAAKVVCVNRITTSGLDSSEAGAYVENNIKIASSNGNYKMQNFWPKKKDDCKIGFNSGSLNSCDIGYDGGAENVNNLCTSLYDSSYDMDIVVTEIDSTSANDISSLHIPYKDMPQFKDNRISRYTMKKFIKEDAAEKMVDHDGCVEIDFSIAFGIGATNGPVTAGLSVSAGFKYEDCSKWREVPGGYTVHMSVYHYNDPSYNLAYSLTPSWTR
jgi:hypothetical protein